MYSCVSASTSPIVTGTSPSRRRDQRAEESVDVALVHGEQELLLAREVQVDGALGESGLVGHLGDVGDAFGRAFEQALGRVENRVMTLLLVFGLNGPLPDDHDTPSAR